MFAKLLSVAALVAAANAEHWIFGGSRPIITTRLDSIVNPDAIGSHVHSIVGASRFKNVYDADDLTQSKCTTIPVQPDKSNYWAPTLFHRDQQTGQLTPMKTGFNIYYLMRPGPKNEPIKAFPKGLRMVAGDSTRRTYNASSFADQAVSFVCLDYSGAHNNDPDWAERPNFFDHTCPDGMRAQVFFPSCWDGVNLDSADHKSHLAYPIQNYNSGDCPSTHPVHLVSLFYEMFVSVDEYSYWGAGTWVFANGDTTGYGHHGDFQNGWDIDLLQEAIDTCTQAQGNVMDCPALAAVFDQASADACVLETQYVDENIGLDAPMTILPGCNPFWDGTGTKPACPDPNAATPSLIDAQVALPSGWAEVGCIAEGTSGRALTGASTTSPNMTRALCTDFCASKGFPLAGVEYSDECYCDSQLRNGASQTALTWNLCSNHCAGNENEICGGPARLTLLTTNGVAQSASTSSVSSSAKPSTTANVALPVSSSSSASSSVHSSSAVPTTSVHSASTASSKPATSSTVATSSIAAANPSSSSAPVPSAPSNSNSTASVPAGWTAVGCRKDNVAGRALNVDAFTSEAMTPAACVAHCAALGHTLAGLEYARECYCGSAFVNGGGAVLADAKCDMACAGDGAAVCGGPDALTVFQGQGKAASTSATRRRAGGHRARAFGRAHQHADVF
ncbi:hypothetical protein GSI_07738 [Ganoderma sinense ZZ0214-1]|uniref:WSC domain-containing protein n=1 Tax=Ganoderma sinense ZZ0214-1 TaxID=1077348 RepID=A0A2G8S8Q3_9APHY|nr:hypothetical protein GSI_07697 [Ganoderma sinense ZZ0214-1]PIL30160.1 hypothetical protein GSI_07738 [Ganoderma sinense ZZ0214-1]